MMLPFYYPTTVIVLDDDPLFLESFTFHFGARFPCVSYTQPASALDHLRLQAAKPLLGERALLGIGSDEDGHRLSGCMDALVTSPERFRRVSVVIVDYDMPAMNGVEFCRSIKALPVRKILLTGKAGLDTAIDAFNEGIIDIFLTKHDPQIETVLPRHVANLQAEFFAATTQSYRPVFAQGDTAFMADPAFAKAFEELRMHHAAAEHYVLPRQPGVLLVGNTGDQHFVAVAAPDTRRAHYEVAQENGAPPELLARLATQSQIAVFDTESGYYEPKAAATWKASIFPATHIAGSQDWTYAVIRPEQCPSVFPAGFRSFYDVQEELDTA